MILRTIAHWGLPLVLAMTTSACVSFQPRPTDSPSAPASSTAAPPGEESPDPSPPTASAETSPSPSLSRSNLPTTKIISLVVEGQTSEVELRLFDQEPFPWATYYPTASFTVQSSDRRTTADQQAVTFYFSPNGADEAEAYVQLVMPNQAMTRDQLLDQLLGTQGLLVTNNWELVDRTDIVSYPWAEEKLIYQQQTDDGLIVGAIYIGTQNDRAFYTLSHYPAEYGDGFEPKANVILENLELIEQ